MQDRLDLAVHRRHLHLDATPPSLTPRRTHAPRPTLTPTPTPTHAHAHMHTCTARLPLTSPHAHTLQYTHALFNDRISCVCVCMCVCVYVYGCVVRGAQWLGVNNSCPVCRFELPTDDVQVKIDLYQLICRKHQNQFEMSCLKCHTPCSPAHLSLVFNPIFFFGVWVYVRRSTMSRSGCR